VGILIALRQVDALKNHIRLGLTNGLSAKAAEPVSTPFGAIA